MEKYIYDNSNGLRYELQGDYYFPCLTLPVIDERSIGIWGKRHLRYIREFQPMLYTDLVLNCKLQDYLADIDARAQAILALMVKQMAEKEGISEQLKAEDQMAWVGAMNNIRNCAEEIVLREMIYEEGTV